MKANTGEVGIELPDLVLLGTVMPEIVHQKMKSDPKTKSIPVVMFTVLEGEAARKLAEEAGCDGYFFETFRS